VVYVNDSGNVGVRTATPEHELDVMGTVSMDGFKLLSDTSYGHVLTSDSSGTGTWQPPVADGHSLDSPSGFYEDVVYVDNNGSVGVGTTDPGGALHVYGDKNAQVILTIENPNTGSASGERISFKDENGDICAIVAHDDDYSYPNQLRIFNNRPGGTIALMGGPVGINESYPETWLDVGGTAQVTGFKMPTGAANGYVLKSSADGTGSWQPSAVGDGHSLDAVDGDPVDVVYVDEYGYVGVGMDPDMKLDIHEASASYCYLRLTTSGTGTGFYDGTRLFVGPGGHAKLLNYEAAVLEFGTDGDTRMTIDSGGKVGIGAYSPVDRLHIHLPGIGNAFSRFTNNTTGSTINDGFHVGIDEDGDAKIQSMENRHLSIGTNGTETIRITANGNVGVGTYIPAQRLHVQGDAAVWTRIQATGVNSTAGIDVANDVGSWEIDIRGDLSDAFVIRDNTPGTDVLTINQDGEVGLGTVGPVDQLHVHEGAAGHACFQRWTNSGTGAGASDGFKVGIDADGHAYLHNYENTAMRFGTNNSVKMIIKSGGNVGIGDDDPKAKLAVEGLARIENIGAWPSAGEGMELAYNPDLDRGYIQVYDREGTGSWGELYMGGGQNT
jgi:hypothetical protein